MILKTHGVQSGSGRSSPELRSTESERAVQTWRPEPPQQSDLLQEKGVDVRIEHENRVLERVSSIE